MLLLLAAFWTLNPVLRGRGRLLNCPLPDPHQNYNTSSRAPTALWLALVPRSGVQASRLSVIRSRGSFVAGARRPFVDTLSAFFIDRTVLSFTVQVPGAFGTSGPRPPDWRGVHKLPLSSRDCAISAPLISHLIGAFGSPLFSRASPPPPLPWTPPCTAASLFFWRVPPF